MTPLLLGLLLLAPAEEGLPAEKAAAAASAIEAAMKEQAIPGLCVAVAQDRRLAWLRGFGVADIENDVAVRPDTVFRLASVSKPITAVAALQLVESGKLDLAADIRAYLPSFPPKPWPITLGQLLGHLGGIRHYRPGEWDGEARRYASLLESLDVFKDDALAAEPGTQYLYSTYGYVLAGAAVEAAAGRPFLEQLRDRVFAPAGMQSTRDDDARAIIPRRAHGYARSHAGELLNSDMADTSYKVPGGGLVAPAGDVARFATALLDGRLLRPESLSLMLTPQKRRDGKAIGYGLGLNLARWQGRREAWHTGGQERVSNILYLWPDEGTAVVLLSNLEGARLLPLARQIAETVQP